MKNNKVLIVVLAMMVSGFHSAVFAQSLSTTERFAEIQELSGEVQVKTNAQESWKVAEKGMRVTENGEIKTGKESTAVVLLDEKGETGTVDVTPNSWMRIAEMSYSGEDHQVKKTMLDLALGQVLIQAEKLKGESSFQVRTPTSTTSVRGTVFEVKVEEE